MSYKGLAVGIPDAGMPFLNEDGTVNSTWYRFMSNLWLRTGLGTPTIAMNGKVFPNGTIPIGPAHGPAFWVSTSTSPSELVVVDVYTGVELGRVQIP